MELSVFLIYSNFLCDIFIIKFYVFIYMYLISIFFLFAFLLFVFQFHNFIFQFLFSSFLFVFCLCTRLDFTILIFNSLSYLRIYSISFALSASTGYLDINLLPWNNFSSSTLVSFIFLFSFLFVTVFIIYSVVQIVHNGSLRPLLVALEQNVFYKSFKS